MWLQFGVKDLIDVLLVAFLLYQLYRLMKNSGTLTIFSGIILFIVAWVIISQVLQMRLLGTILDKCISVGAIVLVILFQDEIRRFLMALGSHRGWQFLSRWFSRKDNDPGHEGKYIAPIVLACMNMARKKTGALIVIQRSVDLSIYIHTGEMFQSDINSRLIENIFFKNSPLHDGAMIIAHNKIQAAGCILPVAQHAKLPKDMGLRHRSGLGLSLETDAIVIIVSEERGTISVAHLGKIESNLTAENLQQILAGSREVNGLAG